MDSLLPTLTLPAVVFGLFSLVSGVLQILALIRYRRRALRAERAVNLITTELRATRDERRQQAANSAYWHRMWRDAQNARHRAEQESANRLHDRDFWEQAARAAQDGALAQAQRVADAAAAFYKASTQSYDHVSGGRFMPHAVWRELRKAMLVLPVSAPVSYAANTDVEAALEVALATADTDTKAVGP